MSCSLPAVTAVTACAIVALVVGATGSQRLQVINMNSLRFDPSFCAIAAPWIVLEKCFTLFSPGTIVAACGCTRPRQSWRTMSFARIESSRPMAGQQRLHVFKITSADVRTKTGLEMKEGSFGYKPSSLPMPAMSPSHHKQGLVYFPFSESTRSEGRFLKPDS